ncbi:hypothetical protein [Bradyrhizobium sp. CCBAU 51627]|uniref:hypothetical protein n=1 Tax=Bradyrhizobium sp. CCBAU 51627 TaxID=1325088 RepID=UPI0023064754|nr:hypothetical protein [Bradyrhizobium sp. CCBAU 51627]
MAITLQQSVQSPQRRWSDEVIHAFLVRSVGANLSEMAAKVRRSGSKARPGRPKAVHPVANAMHQKHGDLAAVGVKSVQIKSSWV